MDRGAGLSVLFSWTESLHESILNLIDLHYKHEKQYLNRRFQSYLVNAEVVRRILQIGM